MDFLGIWWNSLKPTVNYFLMIMIVGQYRPQSAAIQKLTNKKTIAKVTSLQSRLRYVKIPGFFTNQCVFSFF